ncbi:MAG: glycosyltransferase [Bacteroidota bacterium]|nr:glycosyltransferase [Bacteroidota bacterium]
MDWGLGHATRCVPLIKKLKSSNKVIIGTTPLTKTIFDEEFPELQKIELPAYNVTYSNVLPLWLKLLLSAPKINRVIKQENEFLEKIISEHKIELVISDNRFGLYSKKVHSVFITHQVFLKTPFMNKYAQRINQNHILNFDEIWIPDFEDETNNLSGSLSHGLHFHKNIKYIGALSRLQKHTFLEKKFDYLFLISGPEPQQTLFTNALIKKSEHYPNLKFALISPNNSKPEARNLETFISPNAKALNNVIQQSKKIICRSGYSTIMDLHQLEIDFKNVIFVPTTGQTEQEYLAIYHRNKNNAKVISQKELFHYIFTI